MIDPTVDVDVPGGPGGPGGPGEDAPPEGRDRVGPLSRAEVADLQDRYDQMMRLADLFDSSGEQMRAMARLGAEVLRDPALVDSAPLAGATYEQAEDDVRAATTGKHGLLTRSIEVDADALVLRATVLTYRWIDELQSAAYETLGSIAGRAIGYLAPNVALGGAIVSAGLIETDALDRDGVAGYLSELAQNNPDLMDHVTTGGGLLDGLQMRSLLTAGVLAGASGRAAAAGGLRAIGAADFGLDAASALRDVAGGLIETGGAAPETPAGANGGANGAPAHPARPRTLADLIGVLDRTRQSVSVQEVAPDRFVAYLGGPGGGRGRRLRLVGGDATTYVAQVLRALEAAVAGRPGARVMLVGSASGGLAAAQVAEQAAARPGPTAYVVDQVVTAGAPSAHVPRLPEEVRVLALEDRSDPVALLASLVGASQEQRVTVVFDGAGLAGRDGLSLYAAGARAADEAGHPAVRAELERLRELGYLAG